MKYILSLILSTSISIFMCAIPQDSIFQLKIYEPILINGLSVELLNLEQYKMMVGTASILQVEYKNRKDIILMGAGGESISDFHYYWQGFTFMLIDAESATKEKLKIEIIQKDSAEVDDIFNQNTLREVFEKVKVLMDAEDMKVGNRQMNLFKTESNLINASYTIGRAQNHKKWEEKFVERIDIIGQTDWRGYHFSILKDQAGNIMIKSGPTEETENGIKHCLHWFLEPSYD